MNNNYVLKILESLVELNSGLHKRIASFSIDLYNFGLLVYTDRECRISLLKLNLKELMQKENNLEADSYSDYEDIKISLLNVFILPFILVKIICTKNNIWAIGQQAVVDLKPYVESALEKDILESSDECDTEEFNNETFGITINALQVQKCNVQFEDILIGCNFLKYGFIRCLKNSNLNAWQLECILLNDSHSRSSAVLKPSSLDFPVSGHTDMYSPVVCFIHHGDPEIHVIREIFGINCSSPNVLCLIAHSDGKLLWSLCDCNVLFHQSLKLETLFDTKQAVIGIYFLNDIEGFEGYEFMLVVGVLGQVTLFSSKAHASLTLVSGQHPFWITTTHLNTGISHCDIVKNCLLHLNNGTLYITSISTLLTSKEKTEEQYPTSKISDISCIEQMIVLDKNQGLILFLTNSGNVYLAIYKMNLDHNVPTRSLPEVMSEYLEQSTVMQKLLHQKSLQTRLFTAISTFASLKFNESILKEPINFSISEVNFDPRKYILVIDLKCFEKLHLDSELCCVTASVFTYFKDNFSLVTKTARYNPDQHSLCLELTDTVLQPPFVSIFPMFVEVGLILQLPDDWKTFDCFKSISNCLPFYLRIQTFMVHELHLFQSNALCPAQKLRCEKPKAMKIIEELARKRPVSNILQMKLKKDYHLPTKFHLCFSVSTLTEMMKDAGGSDVCDYVKDVLFRNKRPSFLSDETNSDKSPISLELTKNNDYVVITLAADSFESLIGLRIAVMDIIIAAHNQSKHITSSSAFVSIPASIYQKCEDISKSLLNLYGTDVESDEVIDTIIQLYRELRSEVSAKLPIL